MGVNSGGTAHLRPDVFSSGIFYFNKYFKRLKNKKRRHERVHVGVLVYGRVAVVSKKVTKLYFARKNFPYFSLV